MTDTFRGFGRGALTFLRQLKRNNRREWFQEHREAFDTEVLNPLKLLVEELDVRFASFAPEFVGDPKRSIFRIYRDVRFSKDKSPYKTHAACWFNHRRASSRVGSEADTGSAGFYFHLQPGKSFVGGGLWMPPRPSLNRLRDAIAEDPTGFDRIARGLTKRYGGLDDEAVLKKMPRGFSEDHPAAKWLRYQSFVSGREITDATVTDPKLPAILAKEFEGLLPLVRWLNAALGLPQ